MSATASERAPVRVILVVDDDQDIRETIAEVLESEGFDAVTAENGRAALEKLRAGLRPSLILLDLMMPVMDGWQFREEQQRDARFGHIPVVVITAAGNRLPAPIAADRVLPKPLHIDALLAAVAECA